MSRSFLPRYKNYMALCVNVIVDVSMGLCASSASLHVILSFRAPLTPSSSSSSLPHLAAAHAAGTLAARGAAIVRDSPGPAARRPRLRLGAA